MTPSGTRRLLLIGEAATEAMSPPLWTPVLAELGTDLVYEPVDVPADLDDRDMEDIRVLLLTPGVIAANVTMPHKRWAAGVADRVDTDVAASQAANLLINKGHRLEAMNTDMVAVRHLLKGGRFERVLLLGAGGAAHGALEALAPQIGSVIITDRDFEAAEELASSTSAGTRARSVTWGNLDRHAPSADLVINATPIGKHEESLPWTADLDDNCVIYDFVYTDHPTVTVRYAKQRRLRYIDGWTHLWAQAAAMTKPLALPDATPDLLWDSCVSLRGSTGAHRPNLCPLKGAPGDNIVGRRDRAE